MPPPPVSRRLGALLGLLVVVGCDDPLALPPPQFANALDTAVLHALRGTALTLPSGYDVVAGAPARTDRAEPFDFAFDIADDGRALVYPAAAIGVNSDAGVAETALDFEAIEAAPSEGFQRDTAVAVAPGTVLIVRSRSTNQACALLGSLPRYGKLRVLALDGVARTVTFEVLVNANCGYRALQPGLPEN
jgi:hypothetical protein